MEQREQFDEYLGGNQSLPSEVNTLKLVSSRASEIAAMTYSIENPQRTKLVFQRLPVYMRRRVMSHNAKRLPRRLREAHLNQMTKSGLPPKAKRPSRNYRRRPRNLLAEYVRRQRSKLWLETHLWHAKRFRMTDKWGYRLPSQANDKCYKANYRALTSHCLMQDLSYYVCIELSGLESTLKETLRTHCNQKELTFAAKAFINGDREGTLLFFRKDGCPMYPLGYVHFLWRPGEDYSRTLWIWVHPSIIDDVLSELVTSFQFKLASQTGSPQRNATTRCYVNSTNCKLTILKGLLNRFRLCGPGAIRILRDSLRLPYSPSVSEEKVTAIPSDLFRDVDGWYTEYYSGEETMECLNTQKKSWLDLCAKESPDQLPPNIVFAFTVLDPRFFLPQKRTKSLRSSSLDKMSKPSLEMSYSPMWDPSIRQRVTKSCLSTTLINGLKRQLLVPGVDSDKNISQSVMAKIPLLLIQKPGRENGMGASVDVVLPAGWAMPFWLAFILRCARVGALRESGSIAFETNNTKSPDTNEPDMPAYEEDAIRSKAELTERYFRYPPNRRVNFIKVGIASPFFCNWRILMKEWAGTEDYVVLRDRDAISFLKKRISLGDTSHAQLQSSLSGRSCLVRIKVTLLKRGCPKKFAIVCLPTLEDVQKFRCNESWCGPVEKLNNDRNEATRHRLKRNHSSLLKRLRRQRIRRRRSFADRMSMLLKENPERLLELGQPNTSFASSRCIVKEHGEKMSKLYLPECTTVRRSCDREVIGYLTIAGFSFTEARGVGIGYVALQALLKFISERHKFVLVRNTQTRQYRTARLEILL